VAEFSLGMFLDIALNLVPVALVIPDFFAVGADGQKSAQGLHLCQGHFSFLHLPETQEDGAEGDDKGDADDEDIPPGFPVPFLEDILFGMHDGEVVGQAPDLIGRNDFIPVLIAFEAGVDDFAAG